MADPPQDTRPPPHMMHCDEARLTIIWIIIGITTFLFISSCCLIGVFLYRSTRSLSDKKATKASKILFYIALVFLVITSIQFGLFNFAIYSICQMFRWMEPFVMISNGLYLSVHLYLLWIFLFLKIHSVFKETAYALSSYTVIFYSILFVASIISYAFHLKALVSKDVEQEDVMNLTKIAISCINIIISMSLSYLFIYKLYIIYKNAQQYNDFGVRNFDDKILSQVTKTTVVATISLPSSMVVPIFTFVYSIKSLHVTHYLFIILRVIELIDMCTNFLCVLLSFSVFDRQYTMCCSCMDKMFKWCVIKMISKRNVAPNDSVVTTEQEMLNAEL